MNDLETTTGLPAASAGVPSTNTSGGGLSLSGSLRDPSLRTRASLLAAVVLSVFVALGGQAQAQDDEEMQFSVEETGQAPVPPAEGPPSEALANALRLYQQERYQEASVQFQRVVEGETQDAPANVQKAQFFLGKSLYHLRFYQSALVIFDEIGEQGQSHIYFDQTLQWLAQLASQLPEAANIIEKVGRYGVEELEQFNTSESAALYNQLLLLMGRYKYSQNDFEEAVELFTRVDSGAREYVQARFFEGITHIRMRRARPAIAAFRSILDGLEGGRTAGVDDEARMRNLAWISLARVYYTAANQGGEINGQFLGQAVESWNQVEQGSEYWLDALFESSWAFFLADEYARALGNVHTLYSPYFEQAYYPEALVLKAVVFVVNCQITNARATAQRFHQLYDPVQQELRETLGRYENDNNAFYEFLQRVRSGEANLSPRIRGIVASALSDRTILQHLEYVRVLEEESERLNRSQAAFRDSSLGARILQDIELGKSYAYDRTGEIASGRYNRLIRELQDLMNQMDRVEIEILNYEQGQLDSAVEEQMTEAARSGGGDVEVDEEHQLWPFNGEYWRDELGFYRQQVTNQCGR